MKGMGMTVAEAREAKRQPERCIGDLIRDYEGVYGLEVPDIRISHIKSEGFPGNSTVLIKTELSV
jgi:hypothetical protein